MKFLSKILLSALLSFFLVNTMYAQCQQYSVDIIGTPVCDDAGTPNDPSDDTFTVTVWPANPQNPNSTWSSSGAAPFDFSNEPYLDVPPFITFGPYLISDGSFNVTFTDSGGCPTIDLMFVAPAPCSAPDPQCIDASVSVMQTINFDGDDCTLDFEVDLLAVGQIPDPLLARLQVNVTGGTIVSSQGAHNSVSVTSSSVSASGFGTDLPIQNLDLVILHILPIPGECVQFTTSITNPNGYFLSLNNGGFLMCPIGFSAPGPICFPDLEEVCGVIQNGNLNCQDSDDNGVVGVDVCITDECGNVFSGTTDQDGTYCIDVPTGICIMPMPKPDDCPECDTAITEHDCALVSQIREAILGRPHTLTPAQMLAADVNCSGGLSTIDLIILQIYCDDPDSPHLVDNDCLGNCKYIPASQNTGELGGWIPAGEQECGETDFVMVFSGDLNGNCSSCEVEVTGDPFPTEFLMTDNGSTHTIASHEDFILDDFVMIYEKVNPDSRIRLNDKLEAAGEVEITEYGPYVAVACKIYEYVSINNNEVLVYLDNSAELLGQIIVNGNYAIINNRLEARSIEEIEITAWDDSEYLNVQIDEDIIKEAWIFNSSGDLMWESTSILEAQIAVPTSDFGNGIYFIRIKTKGDEILIHKFFH